MPPANEGGGRRRWLDPDIRRGTNRPGVETLAKFVTRRREREEVGCGLSCVKMWDTD